MPRPTNFVAMIRQLVEKQVHEVMGGLLGAAGGPKKKARNGRRKRRGPGRPPGSKNKKRRGPGRPAKPAKGK
jgi:hypothetical protein